MALSLRAPFRRAPQFTEADRAALLDEMLAERFPLPAPTLIELHTMFRDALAERERLQYVGRQAAEELARLDGKCADLVKRRPGMARQTEYDYDRLRAPQRAKITETEQALAELAAVVDWPALEAGEKAFQAAVSDLLPEHNARRLKLRQEALQAAERTHADARAAVDESAPWGPLREALRHAADAEADVILARRALATVDHPSVKKSRR